MARSSSSASRLFLAAVLCLVSSVSFGQGPPAADLSSRIDAELAAAVKKTNAADGIPIFILMSRQNSLLEMKEYARRHPKAELRAHAISSLKQLAREEQGALLAETFQPGLGLAYQTGKSFWIVNALQAKATPGVIAELARSPRVARLYLRTEKPESILIHSGPKSRVFPQPVTSGSVRPFLKPGVKIPWNLKRIGAERAWKELGVTGKGVVVAVMDSGMNYRHPDIRGRLWANPEEVANNNIDDDGNGYVDDYYGYNFANENPNINDDFFHGTICGAIVCGDGSGGVVTGVAPESQIMVLRMYDQTVNFGLRWTWQFYQFDAWEAFQYAVENGAQVVSLSYDWQPSEKPIHAAWRYALEGAIGAGVTLVAGAGNSRPSLPVPTQVTPPASIPDVISVAGTLEDDRFLPLSSRGPAVWGVYPPFTDFPYPPGLRKPEVAAPVSVGDFPLVMFRGTGYVVHQTGAGTSTATPHVSGLAALLLEQNPELFPWEIKSILQETANDLGAPGWDPYFGSGLADGFAALKHGKLPRIRYEGGCEDVERLAGGAVGIGLVNEGAAGKDMVVRLEWIHPRMAKDLPLQTLTQWPAGERKRLTFPVKGLSAGFRGTARLKLTVTGDSITYLQRLVRVETGSTDLALIDDDGGGFFEALYEDALADLRKPYHYRSVRDCGIDPQWLHGIKTLIWVTGEENRETLTDGDISLIEGFMKPGGSLVLIGQHIAQDLTGKPFLSRVLAAELAGETNGPEKFILPSPGGSIEAAKAPEAGRYDQLRPLSGATELLQYIPPDRSSGALYSREPYRILFASSGLEAVEPAHRSALLQVFLAAH
ncbi:MAG: S8 family serine peptidase [Acidobacteria bacterium]|nr:S8 family serine peptidase [Acidobacteriota bacterium]